jgi:hypothetical protein
VPREIGVLTLLAILAGFTSCNSCRHTPKNPAELRLPTGTPQRPQGMKALDVKPGTVPFSRDDVGQFVRTHHLAKSVGDTSQIQVESLDFITAKEVSTRLQFVSTGLPDDQRVAFAVIRGQLYFTGPPPGKPVLFDRAYLLFDVQTGNLLMSGTLERAKQSTMEDTR